MRAIEIHCFRLEVPAHYRARWWEWLSAEERQRVLRFTLPGHGERYWAAHARLRALLGERLGCAPQAVALRRGLHGKPALAGGELQFNLSHSGEFALVGLHAACALGVDIERVRPRNYPGLARRYFTPAEQAWLAARPAARAHDFCRLWTCKEAWMKADGRGLAGLSQPQVDLRGPGARLQAEGRAWFLRELALLPGYAAAVVADAPPDAALPVSLSELPPG